MVMTAMRKGATAGALKFILSGLLLLAAGGLVLTDVGGFFSGGVSRTDLAKVGSSKISTRQFDAMASRNLQRLGMNPADAYKAGYLQEMLNGEIRARLLSQNALDLGILISTEQVAEKLRKILAPMAAPGQEPHDVLKQILVSQGMSEAELTDSIRTEMSVSMLGDAIKSGFADTSRAMMSDLAEFESEERAIEFIAFLDQDYEGTKPPSDEQLKKMYEATKNAFAKPETRQGQLILIDTSKEAPEITEEEVRAAYDGEIEQYKKPESRTIEQAILADTATSEKIATAVKKGKSLKDATQDATGNTTDYLPGKAVEKEQLAEELKEAVFAGKPGDVIGPVETALGSQVIVIKDIVAAHTQSYEDAREGIRKELDTTKTADAKYELANRIDDLLAAGSTPEDIKQEADITIQDLPAINAGGFDEDGKQALASFGEIAQKIAGTLFDLHGEGESSSIFEMADGRMAAVFLEKLTPRSDRPFEEVKKTLEKQWMEDQRRAENKLRVLEILSELQGEKSGLADAARTYKKQVKKLSNLTRSEEPKEESLTQQALMAVFEAPENELFVLDLADGAAIARVTSVSTKKELSEKQIASMKPVLLREMENEAYTLYIEDLRKQYGVDINDRLLEQLYAPRQEDRQ